MTSCNHGSWRRSPDRSGSRSDTPAARALSAVWFTRATTHDSITVAKGMIGILPSLQLCGGLKSIWGGVNGRIEEFQKMVNPPVGRR